MDFLMDVWDMSHVFLRYVRDISAIHIYIYTYIVWWISDLFLMDFLMDFSYSWDMCRIFLRYVRDMSDIFLIYDVSDWFSNGFLRYFGCTWYMHTSNIYICIYIYTYIYMTDFSDMSYVCLFDFIPKIFVIHFWWVSEICLIYVWLIWFLRY